MKNKAQNDKELKEAIDRINHDDGRETAGVDLVKAATCAYCGYMFAMQAQDFSRAQVHGHKHVCQRADCRRDHRLWANLQRKKK